MKSETDKIADGEELEETPEARGRAMRVAAALRAKGGDEFAKPGSIIEVKFVKGESLGLTASRLLALMILTAGGDAWEQREAYEPTAIPKTEPTMRPTRIQPALTWWRSQTRPIQPSLSPLTGRP